LSQTFDWPEADMVAANHHGHVIVTSHSPIDAGPRDVLRLHCRAHAAIGEFAPLSAVLLPEAGHLISPPTFLEARGSGPDPTATCITFRTFSLAGQATLCDTVGLHAFGLPDLQLVVAGEPDEAI